MSFSASAEAAFRFSKDVSADSSAGCRGVGFGARLGEVRLRRRRLLGRRLGGGLRLGRLLRARAHPAARFSAALPRTPRPGSRPRRRRRRRPPRRSPSRRRRRRRRRGALVRFRGRLLSLRQRFRGVLLVLLEHGQRCLRRLVPGLDRVVPGGVAALSPRVHGGRRGNRQLPARWRDPWRRPPPRRRPRWTRPPRWRSRARRPPRRPPPWVRDGRVVRLLGVLGGALGACQVGGGIEPVGVRIREAVHAARGRGDTPAAGNAPRRPRRGRLVIRASSREEGANAGQRRAYGRRRGERGYTVKETRRAPFVSSED